MIASNVRAIRCDVCGVLGPALIKSSSSSWRRQWTDLRLAARDLGWEVAQGLNAYLNRDLCPPCSEKQEERRRAGQMRS